MTVRVLQEQIRILKLLMHDRYLKLIQIFMTT